MQRTLSPLVWLLIGGVVISVLFADLIPMPIDSYAMQRLLLVGFTGVVIVFSLAILTYRYGWALIGKIWPGIIVAVAFIVLAMPFHDEPFQWAEPAMYSAFFLGFVLLGSSGSTIEQQQHWMTVFVSLGALAALLYGATSFLVYIFALSDEAANLSAFIPWGFVNIRYWSHIATWLIPLLPLAVMIGPLRNQRLWRFFVALGAALWWWLVLLSTSRGTMLGLAFGVLVAVVLLGRPAIPWVKVFFRYLAYGVVAHLLLSVLIPSLLMDAPSIRSLSADSSGRVPLFLEAWRMSLENFPFGMGPQSWLTHEIFTDAYRQSSKYAHPHNMYLMWAAEYGWLLVLTILILVCQSLRLFWQRKVDAYERGNNELALPIAAFSASVSAALLHAGASAVFMAPGSMLIGFLVLSVFWAMINTEPAPANPKRSKKRLVAAILIASAMSIPCVYWWNETLRYHDAMERDLAFQKENGHPSGRMQPRFWYHGNFPR